MRFLTSILVALASLTSLIRANPSAGDDEKAKLKIEVTRAVECKRKTKVGDTIEVHYRGTLAADGSEFDASYNRGAPFSFRLGAGMVIKGCVFFFQTAGREPQMANQSVQVGRWLVGYVRRGG